jgi:DNA-binding transcriptional MerR regulator
MISYVIDLKTVWFPINGRKRKVIAMDRTPNFNLKAVISETGLKPDTLRAWERRYGIPKPERTQGGHRLYSRRDIDTLNWLKARQGEGLSISRAVSLWRQLESNGQDPLLDPAYALPDNTVAPIFVPEGTALNELREEWMAACLAFEEANAEQILSYALALYPAETVCLEILVKSLAEVGEGWYGGTVTVQQEHFASELTVRRLETLVAATPAPTRPGRVLIGCAPEDQHALPGLLLTFLLKQRGWDVVFLGARVPAARLEATVAQVRPNLVILTAQHLHAAAMLLDVAQILRDARVPLAYGGRIFNLIPSLRQRIPAHFLGERLELAPKAVEQLLTSSAFLPKAEDVSDEYRQALETFRLNQTLLEAEVWRRIEALGITSEHLSIANEVLSRNIAAALALGDIDFLCNDIAWVEGLLDNQGMPREVLSQYLRAYLQAAEEHLNGGGRPIVEWLTRLNGSAGNKDK